MTNIEKLTARLNACKNPRRVYNALMELAPIIREAKEEKQREALLASLREATKGGAEA